MKKILIGKYFSTIVCLLLITFTAKAQFYATRDADSFDLLKIRKEYQQLNDTLYKSLGGIQVQIAAWMLGDTDFIQQLFTKQLANDGVDVYHFFAYHMLVEENLPEWKIKNILKSRDFIEEKFSNNLSVSLQLLNADVLYYDFIDNQKNYTNLPLSL